jgi:hypothetical protein
VVGFNSFCPTTGIEPVTLITGKELTIYPNPANNFININAADYHNRDILITDMLGKKLYHQCNIMLPLQINTSLFPEGMYNIKVISDEGISNKTFIITR